MSTPAANVLTDAQIGAPNGVTGVDGFGVPIADRLAGDLFAPVPMRSISQWGIEPWTAGPKPNLSAAFNAMFAELGDSPANLYIPAGEYPVVETIVPTPNTSLTLHPQAVVKKRGAVGNANPVLSHILATDPTIDNGIIQIIGGTFDGDDQAMSLDENVGANYDKVHGIVIKNARSFAVRDSLVRHTKGHGINYQGLDYVSGQNLRIDQVPRDRMFVNYAGQTVQMGGGSRRDGITGNAKHIVINGVTGFTDDDLVAVVAGSNWIAGGSSAIVGPAVESVSISNVVGQKAFLADGSERWPWHLVRLGSEWGQPLAQAHIASVSGYVETSAVYIASLAPGTPGRNQTYFGSISIRDVTARCRWAQSDTYSSEYKGYIQLEDITGLDSLTVSGVVCTIETGAPFPPANAGVGVLQFRNAAVTHVLADVGMISKSGTQVNLPPVHITGANVPAWIVLTNLTHRWRAPGGSAFDDGSSAYPRGVVYDSSSPVIARIGVLSADIGDVNDGSTKETITVVAGKVAPFGVGARGNVSAMQWVHGVDFSDINAGRVAYVAADRAQSVVPRAFPYATNSGIPTAGRWIAGMETRVTGAPSGSIVGHRCTSTGTFGGTAPVFAPIGAAHGTVAFSGGPNGNTSITSYAKGVLTRQEVFGGAGNGMPVDGGVGVLETYRGTTSDSYSYQVAHMLAGGSGGQAYRRTWATSAWTAWALLG